MSLEALPVGAVIALLIALVGYLSKRQIDRVETDIKDGIAALGNQLAEAEKRHVKAIEDLYRAIAEAEARAMDAVKSADQQIQKLSGDTNAIGRKLVAFQLEVAKEYVSFDRLEAAFRPVLERLGGIERTQERIFEELKGKADRRDGH